MKYYANYMADAVVRVDDDGNRYIKRLGAERSSCW